MALADMPLRGAPGGGAAKGGAGVWGGVGSSPRAMEAGWRAMLISHDVYMEMSEVMCYRKV